MVEHLDTPVALSAVLSSDRSHRFARVTDVVHWIVDVAVVAPGSRITNLKEGEVEHKGLVTAMGPYQGLSYTSENGKPSGSQISTQLNLSGITFKVERKREQQCTYSMSMS